MSDTDTETVPVQLVMYADDAEVEFDEETGAVTNHDEIEKYDEIHPLTRESVERVGMTDHIVEEGDVFWEEAQEALESGSAVRLP